MPNRNTQGQNDRNHNTEDRGGSFGRGGGNGGATDWSDRADRNTDDDRHGQSGSYAGDQRRASWGQDGPRDRAYSDNPQTSRQNPQGNQDHGGFYGRDSQQGFGQGADYDRYQETRRPDYQPNRQGLGQQGSQGDVGYHGQGSQWRSEQGRSEQGRSEQGRFGGGYGQGGWGQGSQNRDFGQQGQGQGQASHRGKGPQGWQRSDDRILEAVNEALADDHDVDASSIDVQVKDGEVTLSGTVAERHMKRAAEDVVEGVSGVKHVMNQLRVGGAASSERKDPQSGTGLGSARTSVSSPAADDKKPRA